MRTVDDAFETFALATSNFGGTVVLAGLSAMPNRVSRLTRNGAELRLAWDPGKQCLSLEISHGPPSGLQAAWLRLHSLSCDGEILVADPELTADFKDAISYGLELMDPSGQGLLPKNC